ncbi:phasin family protein [Hymenobacter jejuensis]|uniref:Polyhydroxyalkanoate synthesis regulator phasin n=1 Tax=Hymenobacter jejuensis TaxID=2502781 RepID=A0A5B8A591_9BACT|nr:hypothetical protein [Hymenobacter jejuensis]QDA61372.1 hypothetical protein FHG12_15265 [Hymenobacter jejuensis]
MEDLFKKFINAGVGFVSLTTDRVQTTIDALVKESKLSEQEGKKIMDDLKKNTDTKRKELEKQINGIASRVMKSMGVATNADVEELKRTVKGSGSKSASSSASSASKSGASKSGGSKSATATAAGAASKAAGATKKAATKTSAAASTAQKSAAGKAGAAKTNSKQSTSAADNGSADSAS